MKSKHTYPATKLSEYDRKIVDKYSGSFTNYIESNTAKTQPYSNEGYELKKEKLY